MHEIILRNYPYPYRSMLAICSDLDETPSAEAYFSISEFLNTDQSTPIGNGVGLEVGNTIYFDMPDDQFAYWNSSPDSRSKIHALIHSGHIDCFHSFGDLASSREDAQRSLEALERNNCRLRVWIDHARAPTNFGPDIMFGKGDNPKSPAFHADLSIRHGVKYVWTGRVTSMIGQNTRYRALDMINRLHLFKSCRTGLKDVSKKLLASAKSDKYRMHRGNRLVRSVELRNCEKVLEFMRCNPHPCGVSEGDDSRGIADVLTHRYLDRLVGSGGSSIVYTHLGKKIVPGRIFENSTIESFERLAEYSQDGRILVTTTRKLLDYASGLADFEFEVESERDVNVVRITAPLESSPDGLTFYWDRPKPEVFVNGTRRDDCRLNSADETGRQSISIPWTRLEWGL